MSPATSPPTFSWQRQPAAARLIDECLGQARRDNPWIDGLAHRLHAEAGVRLVDLVDHFVVPTAEAARLSLAEAGFEPTEHDDGQTWEQRHGLFPLVRVESVARRRLMIKVDSVVDFLAAHSLNDHQLDDRAAIEGEPLSRMRRVPIGESAATELWAVERHGYRGFQTAPLSAGERAAILQYGEVFRLRQRHFADDAQGFDHAAARIDAARRDLPLDRVCDLFFQAERDYWQARNRAARAQKARQDHLGIGWANHDHHTYRSSRQNFSRLIHTLEQIGFQPRERFYAGSAAGWGAQVLEQPTCGLVVFADVDLSPEEVAGDFAHEPLLAPRDKLGTVGLWCQLHGEAFLTAGLHHLECQFDFTAATEQLDRAGVPSMAPFTNFPHLKQAFTVGEIWPVDPIRLNGARAMGAITPEQAATFAHKGAVGSHLEILERNDGYKGFNQTGISEIILRTDPRGA